MRTTLEHQKRVLRHLEGAVNQTDDEPILEDDYPVFASYFYVADGKVIRSPLEGNVRDLKRDLKATVIRRCAAVRRGLFR